MADAESTWDDMAEAWDDDPVVRTYSQAAAASLDDVLVQFDLSLDAMRILDFGCGTGLLTEQFVGAAAHIDAVDISPKMIEVVEQKIAERNWATVTAATEVPEAGEWDLIVCSSVLAFVDDHPATVRELASRLAPGGLLVHWDWEAKGDDDHGLQRSAIASALESAELTDIDVRTAFSIPFEDQRMEPLLGVGRGPAQ